MHFPRCSGGYGGAYELAVSRTEGSRRREPSAHGAPVLTGRPTEAESPHVGETTDGLAAWNERRAARCHCVTSIEAATTCSGSFPGMGFGMRISVIAKPRPLRQHNVRMSCMAAPDGSLLWRCPLRRDTATAGSMTAPCGCWAAARSTLCCSADAEELLWLDPGLSQQRPKSPCGYITGVIRECSARRVAGLHQISWLPLACGSNSDPSVRRRRAASR
jgi:hypothetical protein